MKNYDLIIFGGSGFTGKHIIEEIIKTKKKRNEIKDGINNRSFSWGVSGRNEIKLKETLIEMSNITGENLMDVPIILADINDFNSLKNMVTQCHVVINAVGPYEFYGEPVIKACIEQGTNYVDINAEAHNLTRMQLLYNQQAQNKHIYIIGACGFDSIPTECGINYLQQHFNGEIDSVKSYLYMGSHLWTNKIHYGTWQSILRFYADFKKLRPLLRELYPESLPESKYKLKTRLIHKNNVGEFGWCIPFPAPDVWAIERSQNYFYIHEKQRPIQYIGYLKQSNIFLTFFIGIGAICLGILLFTGKFGIYLMEKFPRFFSGGLISHKGPTREQMNSFNFSFTLIAQGWDNSSNNEMIQQGNNETKIMKQYSKPPNKKMIVKVCGNNPAYGATCTCVLQSALTIIHERDRLPSVGGVFTPGTAFRDTNIIQNLNQHGLTFETIIS